MKSISVQELIHLKEKGENPFLVDVRTQEERLEWRIPDTLWIPMDQIPERAGEIPTDRDVYIYCRSGNRSGQVVNYFATQGIHNLVNVSGGIIDYEKAGGEIIRGSLGENE